MGQETELKFVGPEEALALLRRSKALLRLAGKRRAKTRELKGVYFDTEDFALRDAGFVLRVRNDGDGFVQTIKATNGANVATRMEVKSEVAEQAPQIDAISDGGLRRRIAKIVKRKPLVPVFTVEVRRTTLLLNAGRGGLIEAAFDTGAIRCGKASLPVSEFELELVKGDPAALISCARTLTAGTPLMLSLKSKSQRGYALAQGAVEAPLSAGRLMLPAGATADEAFARIIGHCLNHLLGNWAAVVAARDAEGVHQMRVALRRLRSSFSLFAGTFRSALAELETEVRWIADVLGVARDLDVFETEVFKPAAEAHGADDRLQELATLVRARRRIAWHDLLGALESDRFRRLAFELAAVTFARPWLDPAAGVAEAGTSAAAFVRERLAPRYARVRKLGKRIGELDEGKRHALRIKLKKLRYAVDFFASVLSEGRTKRFLRRLGALQDVLGEMNDAAVARALMAEVVAAQDRSESATGAAGYAAGVVVGWHLGHLKDRSRRLKKRWAQFAKVRAPWA